MKKGGRGGNLDVLFERDALGEAVGLRDEGLGAHKVAPVIGRHIVVNSSLRHPVNRKF